MAESLEPVRLRFRTKAALFASIFAVAPVFFYWALKAPALDSFIRRKAIEAAAAENIDLRIESFDFDPWGPTIKVAGLSAVSNDGAFQASLDSLRVRLVFPESPAAGFGVEVWAEAPKIKGEVDVRTHRPIPPLELKTLKISDGSLTLNLHPLDVRLTLPNIDVNWAQNSGEAAIRGGRAAWKGVDEPLGKADLKATRDFASFKIESFIMDSPRLRVKASGKAGLLGKLDVSVETEANLANLHGDLIDALGLEEFQPVGVERIKVSGSLGGRVLAPKFSGRLDLAETTFGPVKSASAGMDVSADLESVRVHGLAFGSNVGSVEKGECKISWSNGVFLEAKAEASDFSLRPFMGVFVKDHFPVGLTAHGRGGVAGPLHPELALEFDFDGGGEDLDVTTQTKGGSAGRFFLESAKVVAKGVVRRHSLEFYSGRVENDSASVKVLSGRIDYLHGLEFETDVEIKNLEMARQYLPKSFDAAGRAKGKFGGPYAELQFHYDFDLDSSIVLDQDLGALTGRFDYDLKTLFAHDAAIKGAFGDLAVTGDAVLLPGGAYNLDVNWKNEDLGRMFESVGKYVSGLPRVNGSFFADGVVAGTILDPDFRGTVGFENVSVNGVAVDEASFSGRVSPSSWTLDSAEAKIHGAGVAVSGAGNFKTMGLKGQAFNIDPQVWGEVLARQIPAEGDFSLFFSVSGAYVDPEISFEASAPDAVLQGLSLGEAKLSGGFKNHSLDFAFSAMEEAAKAKGSVATSKPRVFALEYVLLDLPSGKMPPAAFPGDLSFDFISGGGSLAGSFAEGEAPVSAGSFSGEIQGVHWAGYEFGSVKAAADYANRRVSFDLSAQDRRLKANGAVGLSGAKVLDLDFSFDSLDLQGLPGLQRLEGGKASAQGSAVVSTQELAEASGLAKLSAVKKLTVQGKATGFGAAGWRPSAWDFSAGINDGAPPVFSALGAGIKLNGKISDPVVGKWEASAIFDAFDLQKAPPAGGAELNGLLYGRAEAHGVGANLVGASGAGEAMKLAWGPTAASNWSWKTSWKNDRLEFEASEPRGLALRGGWNKTSGADFFLDMIGAPVAGWMKEDWFPKELTGRLTGKAELRAPPDGKPLAALLLTGLDLEYPPVKIKNDGDVHIIYKNRAVEVERLGLMSDGVLAGASGSFIPLESWDLAVDGEFDLALLKLFIPAVVEAEGKGLLAAEIQGPWTGPALKGTFQIPPDDGVASVTLHKVEGSFDDIRLNSRFDAETGFAVDSFDANFGLGTVHVEGTAALDGLKLGDLRFIGELRDIEYEAPAEVQYRFDADLFLNGKVENPRIGGEIRLEKLLYERRTNWRSMVQEALLLRPRGTVSGIKIEGEGLFIDLALLGSDAVLLDNNLGRIPMSVDLRLRGTPPRIFAWGRIDIREGAALFRTREFDISPSSIEFLGDSEHIALLDLHASTMVREYEINADITGPVPERQVSLSSNPSMDDPTDIVSLLFTGAASSDGSSDGAVSSADVTGVEAASFLLGGVQDTLETRSESIGQSLGPLSIDRFHIDPAYSAGAQTADAKITVGKEITDSLHAKYSRLIFGEADQDLELNYTLTRNLSLLGTWRDRGAQERGSFGGEIRVVVPFNRFLFFR